MKLFLSLFLSVCISLAPLYSAGEIPDLMPVYKTDQVTMDAQVILEKMKAALNNPESRKEISRNLKNPHFQQGLFAGLEKRGMAKEHIAELRLALNDQNLQEKTFTRIVNLDMKRSQAVLGNQSFNEETLLQNPEELIAQLNHNIDQMTESDHALGSMAMSGAAPAVFTGIGAFVTAILGSLNIDVTELENDFALFVIFLIATAICAFVVAKILSGLAAVAAVGAIIVFFTWNQRCRSSSPEEQEFYGCSTLRKIPEFLSKYKHLVS